MRPAALANLVCGIDVESLAGTQTLYQLASKLEVAALCVARGLHLPQPLAGSANHEIIESHVLPATPKRIQRFANSRGLGDRIAPMAGGHPRSV
jgi:hypothetical protein